MRPETGLDRGPLHVSKVHLENRSRDKLRHRSEGCPGDRSVEGHAYNIAQARSEGWGLSLQMGAHRLMGTGCLDEGPGWGCQGNYDPMVHPRLQFFSNASIFLLSCTLLPSLQLHICLVLLFLSCMDFAHVFYYTWTFFSFSQMKPKPRSCNCAVSKQTLGYRWLNNSAMVDILTGICDDSHTTLVSLLLRLGYLQFHFVFWEN